MKGRSLVWLLLAAGIAALMMLQGSGNVSGMTAEEQRIAQVLSAMEGAGSVKVALYYAKETGAFSGEESGRPTGAVVVAQGAGSMEVRLNLIRAVRTLLSLEENAVDVFVMEEKGR